MNQAYLLIGGNIGDRELALQTACQWIEKEAGRILQRSPLYHTEAWGKTDQPAFLNQCLQIKTLFQPLELLRILLAIEQKMGRQRTVKLAPRNIDIDILLFNDISIETPELTIPHPEMPRRRFVLTPLAEIAPERMHPVLRQSIKDLLSACPDPLTATKLA
ncbi:MAG: 2-amino-4-hydroxy-6-hydroxymethyldihydropteridine diphosphokinase [Chitinophagaceae bacterium]